MNLKVWKEETFELLLNSGMFQITDCGPLCSPINSFEIGRDDKQGLLLTACSDGGSENGALNLSELPAGTVHSSLGSVTFSSSDMTVVAKEVWPFSQNRRLNRIAKTYITTEKARIDSLEAVPDDVERVHQLIEWVDNVDTSLYVWPHILEENLETIYTRIFSGGFEHLAQHATEKAVSLRRCLCMNIAGNDIYIVPFDKSNRERPSGPGFILYKKFPGEEIRRKIRECLSFAFGLPLIYLGYTLLSEECKFVGFKAVTPYSIDESIYSLQALPPVPVGSNYAKLIDVEVFSRTVNALFSHFDQLNFQHISWLYWHAVCSPTHTQPVQLGAGIEALQKSCRKLKKSKYKTSLLVQAKAKYLKSEFLKIVDAMIPEDTEEKRELLKKASDLNKASQRVQNERFFASLSLDMGEKEKNAWQRRNDAAHGNASKPGDLGGLVRDIQLLKNIFHRIIIRMTGASNQYIDHYSPRFPIRQLGESVEASDRLFFAGISRGKRVLVHSAKR